MPRGSRSSLQWDFFFFPSLCSNKYQSSVSTRGWGCGGDQGGLDRKEQVDRGDLAGLKCHPSLDCWQGSTEEKAPNKDVCALTCGQVWAETIGLSPWSRRKIQTSFFPPHLPAPCFWLCYFAFCCQKQNSASGALNTLIIIDFSQGWYPKGTGVCS